ncbi:acyltransferase [Exiguobacterium sp. SH1S21]|uniref:acyltransferase family protein n=1 Tax=Exiguobacterium sp. SH1S21 TaxID=2510953 RepID=UPI00103DABFF|nr:acyltransferase family protein [Exiguobacterium sp. SH1S21]TCI57232.1 acyltransferase [Exiguobacterium sp. SH1S21]
MRNHWYDNIKGVLVLLVVFGHLLTDVRGAYDDLLPKWVYLFLYTFHMPLFIMLSGYFFRENRYLRVIQLFVVYVIWQVILGSWFAFTEGVPLLSLENPGLNVLKPYWALWYLMAIVIWYVITPYVTQLKGYVLYALLFALLFGFQEESTGFFALRKVIMFYPFFLIGNWMSERNTMNFFELPKRAEQRNRYRIGGAVVFTVLTLGLLASMSFQKEDTFYHVGNLFKFRFAYETAVPEAIWSGPFAFLIVYTVSTLMAVSFALIVPGRELPVFTRAGKYSLYVYLVHVFLIVAWKAFVPAGFMPTSWQQLLVLFGVACLIVLLIISPPAVRMLRPLVEIDVRRAQDVKDPKS